MVILPSESPPQLPRRVCSYANEMVSIKMDSIGRGSRFSVVISKQGDRAVLRLEPSNLCSTLKLGHEGVGVRLVPPVVPNGSGSFLPVTHKKVVAWLKLALQVVGGNSKIQGDIQLESIKTCATSTSTGLSS